MKNLFKINIFTYIFLLLSILSGYGREMLVVFVILVIHELGHFFLMKINNLSVQSITIYPYGGMIKSNMLINTNSYKVLLISLGGIFSQLILWILVFFLFKLGLINIYYFDIFNKYNLYIILFNLIPIYPLDGGRILVNILKIFYGNRKANKYINTIRNVSIILLTIGCSILILFVENIAIIVILGVLWGITIKENIRYNTYNKIYKTIDKNYNYL